MKLSFRKLRNRVTRNNDHHSTELDKPSTSVRHKSLPSGEFFDGSTKLEHDDFAKEKRKSNIHRSLSERWGRMFRRRRQYDVTSNDEVNVRGEHLLPPEQKQKQTRKLGLYLGDNDEVRKKLAINSESTA